MSTPETDAIHGALVEALYKSKIGEYGYLGRPECEQFTEPLVPVVESLIAERIAAGQVHVLHAAGEDIKARIRRFNRLDAHPQYLTALHDAWGLIANRRRAAERLCRPGQQAPR